MGLLAHLMKHSALVRVLEPIRVDAKASKSESDELLTLFTIVSPIGIGSGTIHFS